MGQKSWLEPTVLFGLLFVVVMLSLFSTLGRSNSLCLLALWGCSVFPRSWSLSFTLPSFPDLALCFFLVFTAFCTTPMDTNQWEPLLPPLHTSHSTQIQLFFASEAYGYIVAVWIHPYVPSFPRLTTSGSLFLVQLRTVGMHFLKRIWGHIKKGPNGKGGVFFFGFGVCVCVCISIYLSCRNYLPVPEGAWVLKLISVLSKLNHLQLTCLYYLALKKQRMD